MPARRPRRVSLRGRRIGRGRGRWGGAPMTAPWGWLAALVGRTDVPAEAPPISHPPVGLTGAEVVARALSVVGQGRYRLGKGGRRPANLTPFDAAGLCDCSGFAAWSMGLDRYQPGRIAGDWISTDAIVADAQGPGRMFAVVGRLTAAGLDRPAGWQPGDLVAYPGRRALGRRVAIGHVGVIVEVGATIAACRVCHCAASGRVAVRVSDGRPWAARGIVVRRV